jgi:hypothetical protein
MVETDRPHDNRIGRMRFACWIIKATRARAHTHTHTHTHTEYVIITAFPQQRFREHASILRYAYIICPVNYKISFLTPFLKVVLDHY